VDINITRRVIEMPLNQIVINAGFEGSVVLAKKRKVRVIMVTMPLWTNTKTWRKAGVVDSSKAVRLGLENASTSPSLRLFQKRSLPNFQRQSFPLRLV
jgi:chaperonin GroEL